jgi:isoleucyl-tRNA synthetase
MTNTTKENKKKPAAAPAAAPATAQADNEDELNELPSESFDFVKEEESILKMWTEMKAFETQLKLSENRKKFTFYDGPPFATGLPHYGHILAGTIKDTVTR